MFNCSAKDKPKKKKKKKLKGTQKLTVLKEEITAPFCIHNIKKIMCSKTIHLKAWTTTKKDQPE